MVSGGDNRMGTFNQGFFENAANRQTESYNQKKNVKRKYESNNGTNVNKANRNTSKQ